MQEFVQNSSPTSANQTPPQTPQNRFDSLFKFSPQVQTSSDKNSNSKTYKGKNSKKKEDSSTQSTRGGGGRGGKGSRGGGRGGRGGHGGRGAGAGAIAT